jgi:hypothetical protein
MVLAVVAKEVMMLVMTVVTTMTARMRTVRYLTTRMENGRDEDKQ